MIKKYRCYGLPICSGNSFGNGWRSMLDCLCYLASSVQVLYVGGRK